MAIVSVDLPATRQENAVAHNTTFYWGAHTMTDVPMLVQTQILRRDAVARFQAVLSPEYNPACYDLGVVLWENYAGPNTWVSIDIPQTTDPFHWNRWNLRLVGSPVVDPATGNQRVTFDVRIPGTAPIGRYAAVLHVRPKGLLNSLAQSSFPGPSEGQLVILFNPWGAHDAVAFGVPADGSSEATAVHVKRQTDVIFLPTRQTVVGQPGQSIDYDPKAWNIVPQQSIVLDSALQMLATLNAAARSSPLLVARQMASKVNGRDGDGVLFGKWGTNAGLNDQGQIVLHCEPPTTRVARITPTELRAMNDVPGSRWLLQRWRSVGNNPYGLAQCWMFAGLTCSCLRTLGIPSRVMSGESVIADYGGETSPAPDGHYTQFVLSTPPNTNVLDVCRNYDRHWVSYHTWAEAWMRRDDIPLTVQRGGGWQVLDATPVHTNRPSRFAGAGVPALGPVSRDAMRSVQFYPYDLLPAYAMRNATPLRVIRHRTDTGVDLPVQLVRLRPQIGSGVFTDGRALNARVNLTAPSIVNEGSYYQTPVPPPIQAVENPALRVPYSVHIGEPISAELCLENPSDTPRTIRYAVSFSACSRNSDTPFERVREPEQGEVLVPAGEFRCVPLIVTWEQSVAAEAHLGTVKVSMTASWGMEADEWLMEDSYVVFSKPSIIVSTSREASHPTGVLTVTIQSSEPFPLPLTNAVLKLQCSNELATVAPSLSGLEISLGTVSLLDRTFSVRAIYPGEEVFMASLESDQILSAHGAASIEISGCAGDFDDSGMIGSEDIFQFLQLYFVESTQPCSWGLVTDVNNDGCSTIQDLFEFLANYFANCST